MHVPARQRDASKLQLTAPRPTNKLQLRPRTTTSSERRRTFRALQREREEALVRSLTQLSEEIQSLQRSQQLHRKTWLHTRHRPEGSCARAIHEFFTVFADGLETDVVPIDRPYLVARVLFKEQYLRYLFDPDVVIADDYGLQVVIDQWRRFTALHSSFCIDMGHIDTMDHVRTPPTFSTSRCACGSHTRRSSTCFPPVYRTSASGPRFSIDSWSTIPSCGCGSPTKAASITTPQISTLSVGSCVPVVLWRRSSGCDRRLTRRA